MSSHVFPPRSAHPEVVCRLAIGGNRALHAFVWDRGILAPETKAAPQKLFGTEGRSGPPRLPYKTGQGKLRSKRNPSDRPRIRRRNSKHPQVNLVPQRPKPKSKTKSRLLCPEDPADPDTSTLNPNPETLNPKPHISFKGGHRAPPPPSPFRPQKLAPWSHRDV